MSIPVKIACAQTTATPDAAASLAQAEQLVRDAAAQGCQFVALPEAFDFLAPGPEAMLAYAPDYATHPAKLRLAELAAELGIMVLAGSVSARIPNGRAVNRSVLFDGAGSVIAEYDKIHMFDVDLPGDASIRESDIYQAGESVVTVDTAIGTLGMAICYDVRFPHLFRALAQAGAQIITVPAAFSSITGPLHWHTLLQARAIETGCFVMAPAQCGLNHEGRVSYGHSLIIDPWGRVLADAGEEPGLITAEIDLAEVDRFRAAIPSLGVERVPANRSVAV